MPEILILHDIKHPETGLSIKDVNLTKTHGIELGSMVRINRADHPEDGLCLYVQALDRDCNGTPLYALTHNFKLIGHKRASLEKRLHAVTHGYSEDSLTVVRTAKDVFDSLEDTYYRFENGKVRDIAYD